MELFASIINACAEPSRKHPSCTFKKCFTLFSKIFRKSATSATNMVLFVALQARKFISCWVTENLLETTPSKGGLLSSVRFLERVPQGSQMWRYLWRFKQGKFISRGVTENLLETAPSKSDLLSSVRFLERVPQLPQMWRYLWRSDQLSLMKTGLD